MGDMSRGTCSNTMSRIRIILSRSRSLTFHTGATRVSHTWLIKYSIIRVIKILMDSIYRSLGSRGVWNRRRCLIKLGTRNISIKTIKMIEGGEESD